jgi:hypothetical protein
MYKKQDVIAQKKKGYKDKRIKSSRGGYSRGINVKST